MVSKSPDSMKTTLLVVYNFDLSNPVLTHTRLSSISTFSSAPYKMFVRRINKVILTYLELYSLVSLSVRKCRCSLKTNTARSVFSYVLQNGLFQQPIARHWNRQNIISSMKKKFTAIFNSTVPERSLSIWAELCRTSVSTMSTYWVFR
jgi:hypothetical protein